MGNTEFFRQSSDLQKGFKWREIFSEVFSPHTQEQKEKILVSGCKAYMPKEANMLKEWTKPWMFARFGLIGLAFCILLILVTNMVGTAATMAIQIVVPAFIVPVTIMLFFWEMNVPRNISLLDLIKYLFFSGIISIFLTIVIRDIIFGGEDTAAWIGAPIPEELAKFALVYFIVKKKNYKYILNGLVIGCSVGVGFAAIESAGYALTNGAQSGFLDVILSTYDLGAALKSMNNVNLVRALTAVCGHSAWAAMYGGALVAAKKQEELKPAHITDKLVLITFFAAVLLHTAFNYDYFNIYTRFADVKLIYSIIYFWDVYYGRYIVLGALVWFILFKLMRMGLLQVVDIARRSSDRAPVNAAAQAYGAAVPFAISVSCTSGMLSGRSFAANPAGQILFGREGSSTVRFPDGAKGISGRHCEIKVKEGVPVLIDRGSTYGTYLADGKKLEVNKPYRIKNGMQFYLATKENMFSIKM